MSAGDITQGRRLPDKPDGMNYKALLEGDYCKVGNEWWVYPPSGAWGILSHDITEHEDGTITVSPSILQHDSGDGGWHGYLTAGVWREV